MQPIIKPLLGGQHWNQEIVAELSAAVLCHLVGKKPENTGHHFRYIERYARKPVKTQLKFALKCSAKRKKALNLILVPTIPRAVSA